MSIFDLFRRPKTATPFELPQSMPAAVEPAPVQVEAPVQVDATLQSDTLPGERRRKARANARAGTRILIVDDSPTVVAVLKRMLVQNKVVTLEAESAERGLELAFAETPDLIFLDIVLPGMSGFNALRALRRDERTKNIPIIMMSGNEQATEEFYVQRIGADDFMKKPFSRAEVFARIERMLDADSVPRRNPFLTPPVISVNGGDTITVAA